MNCALRQPISVYVNIYQKNYFAYGEMTMTIYIYREREMLDFGESEKRIKKVENWINQTLRTVSVVIFRSLFREELL